MRAAHAAWSSTRDEFEALRDAKADRSERADWLRHQIGELDALNPQAGEFEELERLHKLAANSGRIAAGVNDALQRSYEEDNASAHAMLSQARRELDVLVELDVELATASTLLAEAEILVAEAADAMRHRLGQLEHDPAEQSRLEQRLAAFHDLARRHRVEAARPARLARRPAPELSRLDTSSERLAELSSAPRNSAQPRAQRPRS